MPLSFTRRLVALVFSAGWAHCLIFTVQTIKEKVQCGFLLHSETEHGPVKTPRIFSPTHLSDFMVNYSTHESSCFNPVRRPSASFFSTWICVQAASLQLILHHFWRAQAGEGPAEGAGVPGVITRFCPVNSLETAWMFCWGLLDPFCSLEAQFRTKLSRSDFEEWDSQHFCLGSSKRKVMHKTPSPPVNSSGCKVVTVSGKIQPKKKKNQPKNISLAHFLFPEKQMDESLQQQL